MSLKFVVPTLGLLAVSVPTQAIDVGGLEVGGYVDSILNIVSTDETRTDFTTTADITFGYSIGDAVSAYVELAYDADGEAIDVQNANITYALNEQASVTMGKLDSWIGWEGLDAPDLWRTNLRNTVITFPDVELNGATVDFAVNEEVAAGIAVVDSVSTTSAEAETAPSKNSNFGLGAYLTYTAEGLGSFDFDIAFNSEAAGDGDDDFIMFSANGTVDALADSGLTLAYDFIIVEYVESELEVMVAANYVLADDALGFPASVTGMLTYTDNGVIDETEFAFALLTNPTGDANFAINAEIMFVAEDDQDDDTVGFFLEALAIIP